MNNEPILIEGPLLTCVIAKGSFHVTVVMAAYNPDRFSDINEGIESILTGTYNDRDVILIVDGRQQLANRIEQEWANNDDVTVLCNDENLGAAKSRNRAVKHAEGEIVAFFDDDAVAHKDWLMELVACYTEHGAVAAGGKMEPIWLAGRPRFLPSEFYWLIGVTYNGFPEEMTEVRNTFASNFSIKKVVFEDLGGFNPEIGPTGGSLLQSAETDLCARLATETGHGVLYNPNAKVGHKIYDFRTDPVFLLKRAFWQGVSKRGMQAYSETELDSEADYLQRLLTKAIPEQIKKLLIGNRYEGATQLAFLLLGTAAVGFGYLYGFVKFSRV
jgi:glycosyltransferase involved in cell wall biosynthesis